MILVVDDSRPVRLLVRAILQSRGYDVLEAENGHLGLQLLIRNPIAVLITDLYMPELSGFGLIEAARQQDPTPFIIAMTAASESGAQALATGADRLLLKPFAYSEVLEAVASAHQRGGPSRQAAPSRSP